METQISNVDIVPLNIVPTDQVITVESIYTPVICELLSNQNVRKVSSNFNHFKNLKIADFSDKKIKNIEIPIGLDNYYQIVTS